MKKLTTIEFIEKAKNIHGDKYDYSKVHYVNNQTKVCITCPVHSEFWQTPAMHLSGNGCPKCWSESYSKQRLKGKDSFIKEAKQIHGEKYDYSKVEYKGTHSKACIICPVHGEFWQTPRKHLDGNGCPMCYGNKKLTTEEFIEKAKSVHGDKYDYSMSVYKNSRTSLKIICPKHGEFMQIPHSHLSGQGCPCCNFSHLENEIKLVLDDNNIVYEMQKRFEWLGKMSLDFYIPSKNIAIECQGSQHYTPYDFFGGETKLLELKERDRIKKKLCSEHDIKLLYYGRYKDCIKNKLIILNEII